MCIYCLGRCKNCPQFLISYWSYSCWIVSSVTGSFFLLLFLPAIWFWQVIPILLAMLWHGWSQAGSHVSRGNNGLSSIRSAPFLLNLQSNNSILRSVNNIVLHSRSVCFCLFQLEYTFYWPEIWKVPSLAASPSPHIFGHDGGFVGQDKALTCSVSRAWNEKRQVTRLEGFQVFLSRRKDFFCVSQKSSPIEKMISLKICPGIFFSISPFVHN